MDRGAWWATVHRVARVGHDLATKPPPPNFIEGSSLKERSLFEGESKVCFQTEESKKKVRD